MALRMSENMLYTHRKTLAALVCDFPADETLVNGLRGMQAYFTTHDNTVDIPVLRVMNAAHDMIARMFNTLDFPMLRCDVIAYEQMSGNPQLTALTLIVLAEMLARTDGCKARACRAALLEQRSDDFFEGMSLYEQFLDAGDAHFAEEDFLIDLMDNINILRAENERLKQELKRQKQTTMPTQPQTVINVAGNYIAQQNIDIHDNENCNIYACPQPEAQNAQPTEQGAERGIPIPRKGDYNSVREYVEERKKCDEVFLQYSRTHTRKQLCDRLTDEFGWVVDVNSYGKNLARNL